MKTTGERALAALWSLQGIGPRTIERIESTFGPLGELLERPVAEWASGVSLTQAGRESLTPLSCLAEAADRLEARLRSLGYALAFRGDPAYPALLAKVPEAPPLLFHRGPGAAAPARRRLAMVGTRHVDAGLWVRVRRFAQQVAGGGVGVVSGAAEGVDQACHLGALDVHGETWAFLGCAIEEMDPPQAKLKPYFEEGRATFFSQYPPGTRSGTHTFPQRNRLICGASDATLVARAPMQSGALYTAKYALGQQRPMLAMLSDPLDESAQGCHELVSKGYAKACLSLADVWAAVGLEQVSSGTAAAWAPPPDGLSEAALAVLAQVDRTAQDFDALQGRLPDLDSGRLAAALLELELAGAIVQKAGRRFERVA